MPLYLYIPPPPTPTPHPAPTPQPYLLMRTLRDMNMSKYVAEDVPLFMSLIDDLFPGGWRFSVGGLGSGTWRGFFAWSGLLFWTVGTQQQPTARHLATHDKPFTPGLKAERAAFPEVSRALEKVALERGYQLHGNWLNKCIQLYETYLVRHGIMLVGLGVLGWCGFLLATGQFRLCYIKQSTRRSEPCTAS